MLQNPNYLFYRKQLNCKNPSKPKILQENPQQIYIHNTKLTWNSQTPPTKLKKKHWVAQQRQKKSNIGWTISQNEILSIFLNENHETQQQIVLNVK